VLDRKSEYAKVTVDKLSDRYKAGYVEAWKKFTGSLRVKPFDRKEKEDGVEALKVLSQHDSVFRAILKAVKEQTTLSEPPISDGLMGWFKSWTIKGSKGADDVEKEFSSLKNYDISGYLGKLEEVMKKLSSKNGDKWRDVANLKDDQDFKSAMEQARNSLQPLKSSNGAKPVADLLEQPLKNIDAGLGLGLLADLDQEWNKVLATARRLEANYPFSASSTHVQAPDLKRFLNPVNGELSKFYERIKNDLDGSPGQLKPRNPGQFNSQFIDYLNEMLKARDALFSAGGEQPKLDFTVSLKPPSGVTAEIIIGDITVRSEGGALRQQNVSWPSTGTLGVIVNRIQDGQPQQLDQFPDTWGLFKMLSGASYQAGQYRLQWSGLQVLIQPSGNNDPFRIRFTQLRAPQTYQ